MKRYYLTLKLLTSVLKLRYLACRCADPMKKRFCQALYRLSAMSYNDLKPGWMPHLAERL